MELLITGFDLAANTSIAANLTSVDFAALNGAVSTLIIAAAIFIQIRKA